MPESVTTERAAALVEELDREFRPLETELARGWWASNTTSSEETERRRQEAELRLRTALSNRDAFAAVAQARKATNAGSTRRSLDRLFAAMQPNQLDEDCRRRLVELETRVEAIYNTHRGEVDGERVDDNQIAEIMGDSDDARLRRAAWEASKSVGAAVADLVLELVRLRNEAARSLGYRDHRAMALTLDDLDEKRLDETLDAVDEATATPFATWKAELDAERAKRFGCAPGDLRAWHYDDPFFQEPPRRPDLDLDEHFARADVEALTMRTYDGMGLDLHPVLAASDLYARDGKSQHAFCIDLDRKGDIRVLANVVPNERWMGTMLHEFGHAAYDRYIDVSLPFRLHAPAHMLATEAIAMLFGALNRDPAWLRTIGGMTAADVEHLGPALVDGQRASTLVFARWALVVIAFERELYRDPEADLERTWWDLVERYQLVPRPERPPPFSWAAKIHLALAPIYYQNYLLGELVASQIGTAVTTAAGGLVDHPEAGRWLVERVFRPGASLRWDHLVHEATGRPLDVRDFMTRVR
jgi:peptidyl-dipeptidase A